MTRIEDDDSGVTAYFEDGTKARGDILVGADGIKSVGKSSFWQNLRLGHVFADIDNSKFEPIYSNVLPMTF